jgi:hypothetical protein
MEKKLTVIKYLVAFNLILKFTISLSQQPAAPKRWRCCKIWGFPKVKIHVEVFWVLKLCSVAIGYKCFRGPCYRHLHPEVWGSKVVWNGITTQKTSTWEMVLLNTYRMSKFIFKNRQKYSKAFIVVCWDLSFQFYMMIPCCSELVC